MTDHLSNGHCNEHFLSVRDAFEQNFSEGSEIGACTALVIDGELVVDLWAGFADVERTRPWREDTIVQVSSSSKTIGSLCGLMLIDRDLIELDEPIATYWPEFAAAGKQSIPVRYIFCHATGLAGIDGFPDASVYEDTNEVTRRLAAQEPWWEPGTRTGYHGMTYNYLINELIRRTDGRSLPEFFHEEIANPLGIDFHFGLDRSEAGRRAEVDQRLIFPEDPNKQSVYHRAMGYWVTDRENLAAQTQMDWSKGSLGLNGVGNARALAKAGNVLAAGGVSNGKRFLSEETAKLPYQEQMYTKDLLMGEPVRWGLGFGLASKEIPIPFENAFHWGGSGGSSVIMIPEHKASWAYTPNNFTSTGAGVDDRGEKISLAAFSCLKEM